MIVGIPARLQSKRFPRKLLEELGGKTILGHVYSKAVEVFGEDSVFICSDEDELLLLAESFGANVFRNTFAANNGTERMAELAKSLGAAEVLNIQADDPTVTASLLNGIASAEWNGSEVLTPVFSIDSEEDYLNPNVVKTVRNQFDQALYFSRAPIPFSRDSAFVNALGHIGIYRYTAGALAAYAAAEETELENLEKLEQLRFLSLGIEVKTYQTEFVPSAVDSPNDIERLRVRFGY